MCIYYITSLSPPSIQKALNHPHQITHIISHTHTSHEMKVVDTDPSTTTGTATSSSSSSSTSATTSINRIEPIELIKPIQEPPPPYPPRRVPLIVHSKCERPILPSVYFKKKSDEEEDDTTIREEVENGGLEVNLIGCRQERSEANR